MSRFREQSYRLANAVLIAALTKLHRTFGICTTYKIGSDGAAALFEGSWFAYSPRDFGSTGNIDLAPQAENSTRQALFERITEGEVFYDIGAHGGVYTITLQKRFPSLQIHSFEPQPEDLLRNLALNDLPSTNVHQVAVGNESGSVKMTTKNRSSNHVSDNGDRTVPIVRLDDYAKNLPAPNWIKIDIEGLELPALRGAEQILRLSRPTIICEINHLFDRFGTSISDFMEYMELLGYQAHALRNRQLYPVTGKSLKDLGISSDNNFWFIAN